MVVVSNSNSNDNDDGHNQIVAIILRFDVFIQHKKDLHEGFHDIYPCMDKIHII